MKWISGAILGIILTAVPASGLELPAWLSGQAETTLEGPPRPVVTEIVTDRGSDARSIPGVIVSKTQVIMAFQTLGRMTARHAELGDRVTEGQLLAELATEDLAAVTRAKRAAAEAAEVQLSTVQTTLERTKTLAQRGVASAEQLEQAQRVTAAAEAAAEQARSELVQAEDAEGFARMKAPFDGVISAVYENAGAVVDAGAPVMQLSADDAREAVIDLPVAALSGIEGQAAFSVWQRNDPENVVDATLDRIDPLADAATRTRRLHLTLSGDASFRLGALIRARVGAPDAPALTLPEEAIFQIDGQPHVWRVKRENGSASVEAVAITPGASYRGRLLVQGGLSEGDEIVIRGVNSLEPGQSVGRRLEP